MNQKFNPSLGLNCSIQMDYINNELFEASFGSVDFQSKTEIYWVSLRISLFVFQRWAQVLYINDDQIFMFWGWVILLIIY